MTEPVNEILYALRSLKLDYRANPDRPDGPWRARCPICRTYSQPDELPLTITKTGHIRCAHRCDPAKIAAALDNATSNGSQPPPEQLETRTTWAPIPLADVLNGAYSVTPPSMLSRTDGHCLLYAGGRVHGLHAEPEALKTWLALKACAEPLRAGESAAYFDFEDGPQSIVQRLLELGVGADTIAAGFLYSRPDEPLSDAAVADVELTIRSEPTLAVIDGVTEALSQLGLNPLDNSDIATWLDLLPRKLARAGISVLLLDHVVKDREQRGRYAIGGQHKLAGVDVAYSLRVIEPFAPGRDGLVSIKVEKDRPGRVREFAPDGHVALLRASSDPDGQVRIKLEPPEHKDGNFRPTVLMQRISTAVENDPGLSKRAIRETVRGQTKASDLALELLIAEGYIDRRRDGPATRHHPIRPYREADDQTNRDHVTKPRPDRDPVTGEVDRDHVTPPIGGTVTSHAPKDTANHTNRDPNHKAAP